VSFASVWRGWLRASDRGGNPLLRYTSGKHSNQIAIDFPSASTVGDASEEAGRKHAERVSTGGRITIVASVVVVTLGAAAGRTQQPPQAPDMTL
jgi:hypothetical protein